MTLQLSTTARNNRLDSIETTIGTDADLLIYSGSAPANCAASATGTLLATMALPSDSFAAASGGSKAKSGTWSTTGAAGAGSGTDAGYFRIVDGGGACHVQGSVGETAGTEDLLLDNANIATGQTITISGFTLNDPNG